QQMGSKQAESTERVEYDVLIVGGGFAGVYCGKALAKLCRRDPDLKVGLVSADNHMVFQPMLPEVAAASISPRHVVNPIRQLCKGIDVFRGEVNGIDAENRSIRLNAGDYTPDIRLGYRRLVLAPGAVVDLSRVPGMSEHALLMRNVGDAMKLRARVISRFEEANLVRDEERKRRLLSLVVVGGGYSGVETAGEMLDLMTEIHQYYENVSKDDFKVTLVHSGDHLLPTLSRKLGEYCERVLRKRGLNIIFSQRVKAVTAESVILNNEERIGTNTVVCTIGNAPNPLVTQLAEELDLDTERGRIKTTPELQVEGRDDIWAIGDCAAVPMNGGGTCPPTAQFAQRQGTRAGRNIGALIKDGKPEAFDFSGLGELAAIGHRQAVAEVMGVAFSGFIAWWMWRTIYVMKLPGLQRKLRVLIDWTFDLFFPRDINLLNPRYSTPLKRIHLEPDDVLFYPDEPAFSVYFVHEGEVEIRDGDKVIKRVRDGEYFGERALLDDGIWHYRAQAAKPTKLVALGKDEFKAIVEGSRDLKELFQRSAISYGHSDEFEELKQRLSKSVLDASIREIMIEEVDCLEHDMELNEVLERFREQPHGSYPVLDEDGACLGTLKRDVLYDAIKKEGLDSKSKAKDLRLSKLPIVSADTTVDSVLETMMRSGRNKVIVGEDGKMAGLITLVDVLDRGLSKKKG
ncbi:MAG: FAD-dependent oxidoreductase, partial [Akkermansiaceae bacterium]|nr:FAD-dependent oxidoreductase [Akkermansiaceae bacterium]